MELVMGRKKIDNLKEHYLKGKPFLEAGSKERNRFLDEVVRRYVREANKKYKGEDKYVVTYENDDVYGEDQPSNVWVDVYSLDDFATISSCGRVDCNGFVNIGGLGWKLFGVHLTFTPFGRLSSLDISLSRRTDTLRRFVLSTHVDKVDDPGFNYDVEGFLKIIDKQTYTKLKTALVGVLAESAPFESFIRTYSSVLGPSVVVEPRCRIFKAIEQ
jgi:hypothetical protein